MEKKVQIAGPDGKQQPATSVDVEESTERWSELRLSDGTTLRTKIVVVGAFRVDDSYDADRNPVYIIKSHNVVAVVDAPENLKRKVH